MASIVSPWIGKDKYHIDHGIEAALTVEFGYEELAFLLLHFVLDECGRGEDKTQLLHSLQLLLQRLKGIYGEGGCRYRHTRAIGQLLFQVVYHTF